MNGELKDVEAALAHDLNNDLQVVMGNLEVLRRRATFLPEVVTAALNASRNAAQLADRLVSIGRLRHLEPQALDINQALTELQDMIARTVGETVRVQTHFRAGLAKVRIDPRCLQIALLELATNSRAAMPAGGELKLSTLEDGKLVHIIVEDTGHGIAPETLERAFDPFARGGGKPAGFGLHIVERCVRQSGGRVEIARGASQGTIVTLYLPTE
jgi:signal transduction histidine kinase